MGQNEKFSEFKSDMIVSGIATGKTLSRQVPEHIIKVMLTRKCRYSSSRCYTCMGQSTATSIFLGVGDLTVVQGQTLVKEVTISLERCV